MRKDLRFPLRSFEFERCGKSDKRIVAHQRSVLVHHVQVTPPMLMDIYRASLSQTIPTRN